MTEAIAEPHTEHHMIHRTGWLRAAVLGANDGLISVASLLTGVAAARVDHTTLLITGLAGLTAGALSMAAGEYVSVSSQADTEAADLELEREALKEDPEEERKELAAIYIGRGLDPALAGEVARQLMAHDALGSHARDELGITNTLSARPFQAAIASAASFAVGALVPVAASVLAPVGHAFTPIVMATLIGLVLLGYISASAGGASPAKAITRITILGAGAMALTTLFGLVIDTVFLTG